MKSATFFIVPRGARASLTNDGWIFSSDTTIAPRVIDGLVSLLNVRLVEEYLGIRKFENQSTQMNVVLNEKGEPSEVALRTRPKVSEIHRLLGFLADEAVDVLDSRSGMVITSG
jgi:hypothetical protein